MAFGIASERMDRKKLGGRWGGGEGDVVLGAAGTPGLMSCVSCVVRRVRVAMWCCRDNWALWLVD